MAFLLSFCSNCSTAYCYTKRNRDYYKCPSCGAESFTDEWARKHPDHPTAKKYLEKLERGEIIGEDVE